MINIGCAGIGGFGNQISKLATMENFDSLAINSSKDDLVDLEEICTTILIGENGCGKDRNLSKSLIKDKYQNIIKDFKEQFSKCRVVFVVASGDGGTGSGGLPILTALLKKEIPNIIFVPVIVMPLETESVRAHNNTKECIKELNTLGVPFIIKDNNRTEKNSLIDIYESINMDIIKDFKIFRGDYCEASRFGNMDDRDRLKILATPGLVTVNKVAGIKENNLDKTTLNDIIISSIKDSYNVDIERDKVVKRMGFINVLPENLVSKMDKSYSKVKEYAGEPLEVFEHLTVNNDTDSGSIISIMSGLTYPITKIEEINDLIKSKEEALTKKKKDDSDLFKTFDFLDNDSSLLGSEPSTKESIDDILKQF